MRPFCMPVGSSRFGRLCATRRQHTTVHTRAWSSASSHNGCDYVRLSSFWIATAGMNATEHEDAHAKLVRAGFLRQSHAGIFHMLPLGQRVQDKLEKLIDKHMLRLGAHKVSLSSISSQALWEKTGRLDGYGPELLRFSDRREVPYLLAPTHEEEITALVAKSVKSYKSLPLRLYQIGRKYRDEMRPRHGVLRSREFLMKDLYTFDRSVQSALDTYDEVREAYRRLFDELNIPYLVAEASSGDMGGDLSHEYLLATPAGEDNVVSCDSCDYVANEELASARIDATDGHVSKERAPYSTALVWRGVSKDRKTLVNVWFPASTGRELFSTDDVNTHAIKSTIPDLDPGLGQASWMAAADQSERPVNLVNIVDYRLGEGFVGHLKAQMMSPLPKHSKLDHALLNCTYLTESTDGAPFNALRISDGDGCPRCESGHLQVQRAVELGHTFHLGTRYSEPLGARIQIPNSLSEADTGANKEISTSSDTLASVPIQMGCHGIGVSRIIGAVAHRLADAKGLNWPRAIAPFEVLVIPARKSAADATALSEELSSPNGTATPSWFDVALDDRPETLPWKLNDADLIGYPVVVIFGRRWESERLLEVQCRRLSVREHVSRQELPTYLGQLLSQL